MNLEIVIKSAFHKLKESNIKSALLDSELLLSKVLKKSREYILLNLKNSINRKEYDTYQKMVNLRSQGMPIAYLTKKKYFWKYEFFINDKVLIPRPDTEIIVEQVLKIYKKKKQNKFIRYWFWFRMYFALIIKRKKRF